MSPVSSSKTVSEAYSAMLARDELQADDAQWKLVRHLDELLVELRKEKLSRKSSSLGWLFSSGRKTGTRKGLYIHGGVGRGKSMLMDIFFDLAPGNSKRRTHFNKFMEDAHERIHAHRKAYERGETREEDPIKPVGRDLASEARLLCFDEFSVTDIADAMILGRLFSVLFEKGTRVIATSNVAPDNLYRDGLNRELFLPFIEMLKKHCEIFELDARTDFRLEKLAREKAYLSPLNTRNEALMKTIWDSLTSSDEETDGVIELKGRKLVPKLAAGRAAWFTFSQLCEEARGAADYLALAERFSIVFIEGVPMMDATMRNQAKRFILLIDTLYDNHIRTVVSAAVNPHALYTASSGNEMFEFRRTTSRLIEMQSKDYVAGLE